MASEATASLSTGEWAEKAKWSDGPKLADVRAALENGADVNEAGSQGQTPLMLACSHCLDAEVVPFLLSKGAKVDATDSKGANALHLVTSNASRLGAGYAVALLGAGADPRVKDGSGSTAIAEAKKKKNAGVLAVLEGWVPPKPSTEALEAVRATAWWTAWRKAVFAAVDKAFDGDSSEVELLGIVGAEDEEGAHVELSALVESLEGAYRDGSMGGGSFRQCSQARIGHDKVVSRLSKVPEERTVVIVYCAPEGKRAARARA